MNNSLLVIFTLIVVQLLFGLNFSVSKVILKEFNPFVWSFIRFFVAALAMIVISIVLKKPHPPKTKKYFFKVFIFSLLGMSLGQGLFLWGLNYTSSVNTALITSCIPVLTTLILLMRGQEELSMPKVIGLFCSFLGVIVLRDLTSFQWSSDGVLGDGLVFLAALCFALYLGLVQNFMRAHNHFWTTSYLFLFSALVMGLYSQFFVQDLTELSLNHTSLWTEMAYSIFAATLMTYLLSNWALRHVSGSLTALFIYLQPIAAAFFGYIILKEQIHARTLFSGLLILLGLITVSYETYKISKLKK